MGTEKILFWSLIIACYLLPSTGQYLGYIDYNVTNTGICKDFYTNTFKYLQRLQRCVVIMGNLQIVLLEQTTTDDFMKISFPNLIEVTGYVLMYRIKGLQSIGQLFPNLVRIRGAELLGNFGLIIYDLGNLKEVGLYKLLKIDRGGVIISSSPLTCYVNTIDWKVIAPKARHVLNPTAKPVYCPGICRCSNESTRNHCWNNIKCQRFIDSPEENCHEQCLGCKKISKSACLICRHFTHNGECVSSCPDDTIILPASQYCITRQECAKLYGWSWNRTCVFHCPINYKVYNNKGVKSCEYCSECAQTCQTQHITTLDSMQKAANCVYINGSLEIYVRAVPEAMEELETYLHQIKEVSDFIYIYGSLTITSLHFLSSLQRIRGRKLKNERYSLVIHEMHILQTLFPQETAKHLLIDKGTVKIFNNPMLCFSEIDSIRKLFPSAPNEIDIPQGMNGYSSSCNEVSVLLGVQVINETSAVVSLPPKNTNNSHHTEYTILYVKIPAGYHNTVVPESCSYSEWSSVGVTLNHEFNTTVELRSLRPSSTYAICVESYDPLQKNLARSSVVHFQTWVGKPAPPFITELVAASADVVVVRWLDHPDYHSHITHYELDVTLIEIEPEDITAKDHCKVTETEEFDPSRHALIMKPPIEYGASCETMCGILSTVTKGAMVQDYFDICGSVDGGCIYDEYVAEDNSTVGNYVRTLKLRINGRKNDFQIGLLAPYRDYRVRIKACTEAYCSQSSRGVVRTLPSKRADYVTSVFPVETGYGELAITWKYPIITNGPILAYYVQIVPDRNFQQKGYPIPQVWCVPSNETNLNVRMKRARKYFVRICTSSLIAKNTCINWIDVKPHDPGTVFRYGGLMGGAMLWLITIVAIRICKPKNLANDEMCLVENIQ